MLLNKNMTFHSYNQISYHILSANMNINICSLLILLQSPSKVFNAFLLQRQRPHSHQQSVHHVIMVVDCQVYPCLFSNTKNNTHHMTRYPVPPNTSHIHIDQHSSDNLLWISSSSFFACALDCNTLLPFETLPRGFLLPFTTFFSCVAFLISLISSGPSPPSCLVRVQFSLTLVIFRGLERLLLICSRHFNEE